MYITTRSKEEVVQEFRIKSIQEATLRVISRKGMAAATMQEIAAEAGVAKGTIYLYFRDRDELVEKTFQSAMGLLMERVDAALEMDVPFAEKLRAVMSAKFAFFSESREFFRLYLTLRMPEGTPEKQQRQRQQCQPQYQSRVQKLVQIIESSINSGEIRRVDPQRLALFVIEGSTAVILDRLGNETPPDEKQDIDFIVDLILDGVRERSGS